MKKLKIINLLALIGGVILSGCSINKYEDKISNSPNVKMDETFYNPLDVRQSLGDPWLYKHTDGYYYYTRSGGQGVTVTKTKSMTMLTENPNDETRTKVLFYNNSINKIELWAPEVFFFNGHWYSYFTLADDIQGTLEKDTSRRTYGAKSKTDDIFGEWETPVKIDLPDDYRSIDATFFEYNGKQYIVYAGWPNAHNLNYRQELYIQELEQGNPLKVASSDTKRHVISEPNNIWEIDGGTAQNEGPAVGFAPDGTPIIFFSGSYSGGDNYCIGYLKLVGENLLDINSWEKSKEPLMQKDMAYSEIIAPGHNSITKSPDGTEDWICYHSAKKSGSGWDRQTRLQKLTWDGNTPVVEKIYKASDEAPLPSGDNPSRYKFEAELATLTEDCVVIEQDGFASNKKSISITDGGKISYEVMVPKNGRYALGVRYSNYESEDKVIKLKINGNEYELFAPYTQYDDTYFINWMFVDLYIKPNNVQNSVEITCNSAIYIDCLVIDYLEN